MSVLRVLLLLALEAQAASGLALRSAFAAPARCVCERRSHTRSQLSQGLRMLAGVDAGGHRCGVVILPRRPSRTLPYVRMGSLLSRLKQDDQPKFQVGDTVRVKTSCILRHLPEAMAKGTGEFDALGSVGQIVKITNEPNLSSNRPIKVRIYSLLRMHTTISGCPSTL